MTLRAENLSYGAGGRLLLDAVSLQLEPGRVHAILGANGAGKSTLLRLLARELAPAAGRIVLNGRDLQAWTPQALARQRAVLPQADALRFGFTAAEVVALGRLPCARQHPAREEEIVREALRQADALDFAAQRYPTLSGGERRRVQFARVLAQLAQPESDAPRYLLLDEPTAGLDLRHQHRCLQAARHCAAQGIGVAAVLHDPNLALRYADSVSLLRGGRLLAEGAAATVLDTRSLSEAYQVQAALIDAGGQPQIVVR